MKRPETGRGLFYTRDSGGRHETTPTQYVDWVIRQATELGVTFSGTADEITRMIAENVAERGDLFLDYDVSGNQLSRRGLDALIQTANQDRTVSHLFIPRRDRLARPDNPLDAMLIESQLRGARLTLVFMDKVCPPLPKGNRQNIADMIGSLIDYDQAGQFRRHLAEKMVYAQLTLAQQGYSTGGRAPYAFDRYLVQADGTVLRKLGDGEVVRKAGCHVVWLPAEDKRLSIALRIREMLRMKPASRVAAILNEEGVPSPDAGRTRKDNGVKHRVSGLWSQSTIINIGRNPLFIAIMRHGVRSLGDQVRFTPHGPRELIEDDYRADSRPKVIRNPEDVQIRVPARFEPLVLEEDHASLGRALDIRAGTQKGKPRSRNPCQNPLGCRVYDFHCGWPMYRVAYKPAFRYTCGRYQQSHGQQCAHNHVDGPTATRLAMSCVSQLLLEPTRVEKLKRKLEQLAHATPTADDTTRKADGFQRQLAGIDQQLETVGRNLARAADPNQFRVVSQTFEELKATKKTLEREIEQIQAVRCPTVSSEQEIHGVLNLVDHLSDLANRTDDLSVCREIIELTNLRMFFRFEAVPSGKRILNKVAGGTITLGDTPAPIEIYAGPIAT